VERLKSRRKTKAVRVGDITVGGGASISVQSMWKAPLAAVNDEIIRRVKLLSALGCDILRFSVPNVETADRLGKLAERVSIPLVADIHFDYRIALKCLDWPIAKIRLNPGNIGADWKVREVVQKAKDRGIPIRVGINGGSLPKGLRAEKDRGRAMLHAAEEELSLFDRLDFDDVIFSLKASEIDATVRANTLFSEAYPYPLHLGLTEAGPLVSGIVKSTFTLTTLLRAGIGDTIRISLSDSPENEIVAGREILRITGMRQGGINIVSCPTCGRTDFNVRAFLADIHPFLMEQQKDLTVAIMGCPVNGPEEARHAQLGITGTDKYAVIFKEGKIIKRVPFDKALESFKEEIRRY